MPKILLVEDEENLRELVSARLEQNGYEITTAVDGYQAVSKVRTFSPDLIILDLMIPKMDGYTVCRMLKSGGMADTPIILFSARSNPDDVRRGMDMGANAFVSKPFEPAQLIGKIEELLAAKNKKPEEQPAAPPQPAPQQAPA
jgi:DNA-binding response OmpR family regulator